MAITTDHVLTVLSGMVLALVALPIGLQSSDPAPLISRDCAIFYGELGALAEAECRVEMAGAHGVPAAPSLTPKRPKTARVTAQSNKDNSIALPSLQ